MNGCECSHGGDITDVLAAIEEHSGMTVVKHAHVEKQFPNASLGLAKKGQNYAQVITPGYIVNVTLKDSAGTQHERKYHSNLEGSILRQA